MYVAALMQHVPLRYIVNQPLFYIVDIVLQCNCTCACFVGGFELSPILRNLISYPICPTKFPMTPQNASKKVNNNNGMASVDITMRNSLIRCCLGVTFYYSMIALTWALH